MIFKIFDFVFSSTPSSSRKFSTVFSSDGSLKDSISSYKEKGEKYEQDEKQKEEIRKNNQALELANNTACVLYERNKDKHEPMEA